MIRFLTVDIFVILSAATGSMYYLSKLKRRKAEKLEVKALFVGGPLDGEKRTIVGKSTYEYRNSHLPGVAVYRHTGYNVYEFDGYAMEGGDK